MADISNNNNNNNNNNSSSSSSPSTIGRIGEDQLISVLLLLPVQSILSFGMTCKRFKSISYSDSLWESLCTRDFYYYHFNQQQILIPSWKMFYQQLYQCNSVSCQRLLLPDDVILPTPRASHSINLISGCLFLFGGGSQGGKHLDDTWISHIGNDYRRRSKWEKISSGIPSGRFSHSCVVVNDSLVLFGGIRDDGLRQNDTWIGRVTFHHDELNVTLSWTLLDIVGSLVPPPRGAHAGCCIGNNKMLIHGGIGPSRVRLGDTWVLQLSDDLSVGTWREIVTRTCPPPRSGHTITYVGGSRTILFAGRGLGYEVLNDVWLFDTQGDEGCRWVQITFDLRNIPQGFLLPRVGHSASLIIGRKLLIYGGEDSYRNRKNDFWILDVNSIPCVNLPLANVPSSNRLFRKLWRRVESKGDLPNCRSFHGACVDHSGRYMYVFGGMVDGVVQPADPAGLRFDGETFLVEVVLDSQV